MGTPWDHRRVACGVHAAPDPHTTDAMDGGPMRPPPPKKPKKTLKDPHPALKELKGCEKDSAHTVAVFGSYFSDGTHPALDLLSQSAQKEDSIEKSVTALWCCECVDAVVWKADPLWKLTVTVRK
eukprot:gene14352-17949_t